MKRALCMLLGVGLGALVPSCTTERVEPGAERELATLRARFPGVLEARGDRASAGLRVELPSDARGELLVEDPASGIGARVRLEDAKASARSDVEGLTVFAAAGIVMRAGAQGVEDFVSFERRPAREEVVYTLAPSGGASLRLVERTLELVDANGAPRVRMNAPYVIDRGGARIEASVAVEGCAYDASPAPPWDRATTRPGAARCTIRIGWHAAEYPALLDPAWTTTGTFDERDSHVAVKLATGRVLVTYGEACGSGGCPLASAAGWLYDPATKTFGSTGGAGGKVASTPGVLLGNGKALVLGPPSVGGLLYDPALGTFGAAGPSAIERSTGATLTVLASGKVLAAGGSYASASAEIYDPAASTFTATPALKAARSGHTATLLGSGRVLLTGGGSASAELYDPVANTFTLTGSMSVARTDHAAVRLASGKVLVVGGASAVAELYDPATGTFAKTGSLADTRTYAQAALMRSGNVYVTGGFLAGTATPIVERYVPSSGQFDVAPFLVTGRGRHRVTLLDSGILLATGGRTLESSMGFSMDSAEELGVTAPGAACVLGDDCSSGVCDQGVCCVSACTATCQSCAAGTGLCVAIEGADDPSSCTGDRTCDATGSCKKKIGRACAANADCASGACADGVCCDRACTGTCEACDGANPGTCETVAGKPHGARSCASDGSTCGGACDGTLPDRCSFPGQETGCGTSCAEGVRTAGACDGRGACISQGSRPCPGNYACADDKTCRTTCVTDAECARGYACTEGKCTPTAYCDGDHTIIGADGKSKTDCMPFRCDVKTNRCRTSCEDVEGCAEPFLCDTTGQCVAPPKAPSGCSTSRAPGSASSAAFIVTALGMLLARRRR